MALQGHPQGPIADNGISAPQNSAMGNSPAEISNGVLVNLISPK